MVVLGFQQCAFTVPFSQFGVLRNRLRRHFWRKNPEIKISSAERFRYITRRSQSARGQTSLVSMGLPAILEFKWLSTFLIAVFMWYTTGRWMDWQMCLAVCSAYVCSHKLNFNLIHVRKVSEQRYISVSFMPHLKMSNILNSVTV